MGFCCDDTPQTKSFPFIRVKSAFEERVRLNSGLCAAKQKNDYLASKVWTRCPHQRETVNS
ncbi:hypothetical protein M2448_000136 [Dysgonomonas sp. PF1-14]|nr:hypothetical protein [Dysgonomonas sp. PF1-14]MDH6396298.1 hypothetical protein [Dysgonomonas sp. PF1-23]